MQLSGGRGPLGDIRVLELGRGMAASFCARLFADLGADVIKIEPPDGDACRRIGLWPGGIPDLEASGTFIALNLRKCLTRLNLALATRTDRSTFAALVRGADVVVQDWTPNEMSDLGTSPDDLAGINPRLVSVCITPFGLDGPYRDYQGSDLIAFHAGGVARFLIGQVEDLESTPPVRAYGNQSEFVAGVTAACAGMIAIYGRTASGSGSLIDVSMQEAMASMVPAQLAQFVYGEGLASRRRESDAGGTTVCVLPACDGYVAISPREERQWQAWVGVMGDPPWARDARFLDKPSRAANWNELYRLMREWSRERPRAEIVSRAQGSHVPAFPWATPSDHLNSPQLRHRGFYQAVDHPTAGALAIPGTPFGLPLEEMPSPALPTTLEASAALERWERGDRPVSPRSASPTAASGDGRRLPLEGIRVFDLSWVIAGPACTRYLAAMGAEVIKVEAPGRPDPNRPGRLHEVLGQSKLGIVLDLKSTDDLDIAREIIRKSDVVVENFATGVMERLGLGDEQLRALRPDLAIVSASGMGRSGPEAGMVAYGTLLQAYTGFSGLNGYQGRPPAIGMAWTDFVCGLAMAFATVAVLHERRRTGRCARIDLSMVETQLMTMPGPLLDHQMQGRVPQPLGNRDPVEAPHNVYRCAGDDRWIAIAIASDQQWHALCDLIAPPAAWRAWARAERKSNEQQIDARVAAWAARKNDLEAMRELQVAGVPAGASLTVEDLYADPHLRARGFFISPGADGESSPYLPGLPWRWSSGAGPVIRRAPAVGQHNDQVLARFKPSP